MALQNELTKVNNEQIVLSQLLDIAEFFRNPQNRSEKIDNFWTFEKINSLLRSWAVPFNSDLKQATFEEVLDFLKRLLPEERTQTTVPNSELLKDLIEKSELAASKSDETRQNAILKAEKEIRNLYRKNLEKKLAEQLTQSPIPPETRAKIANDLSLNLQKNIKDSNLPLFYQKLESTPPETPEYRQLEQEISFRFSGIWRNVADKTAATHNLTAEQAEYLRGLSSPAYELTQPLQTWAMVNRQKGQIFQRITEGPAEEITETLVLNRVFAREKPIHLTPEKRNQEIRTEWQKAIDYFLKKQPGREEVPLPTLPDKQLAEISFILDNIQKTTNEQAEKISRVLSPPLTPEKASLVASELVKYLPDNLSEFASPLPTSQEIEEAVIASIWQMAGSEIRLKPEEIAGIANALIINPQTIIPLRQFSQPILPIQKQKTPKGNPLQITENNKTVIRQVKEIIFKQGINFFPESDLKLTSLKENVRVAVLIQAGITPQDLESHVQKLIKTGLPENSPQIREIREAQRLLPEFLQKAKTAGLPQKAIQNWQKRPLLSVRLFLSRFNTFLTKTGLIEKIKIPLFKFVLERSAQTSLQKLYSLVFAPRQIKEPTVVKLPSQFSQIGRQSLFFIGEKILPPRLIRNFGEGIASVFTGQNRGVNSFISSSQNLLSSLTSISSMTTNIGGFLIAGLVAVIILVFVVIFGTGGAMYLPSATTTSEEPGSAPPGLPPQCQPSRHFAEEVICTLRQCGIYKVTTDSLFQMRTCISNGDLQGKEILRDELSRLADGTLQCIGFVDAIQKALGQSMGERRHACTYAVDIPANYTKIVYNKDYTESPWKKGDIAVWLTPYCGGAPKPGIAHDLGHIAIVIEDWEDSGRRKITVAETNGMNGETRIVSYAVDNPNDNHSPTVFLR